MRLANKTKPFALTSTLKPIQLEGRIYRLHPSGRPYSLKKFRFLHCFIETLDNVLTHN